MMAKETHYKESNSFLTMKSQLTSRWLMEENSVKMTGILLKLPKISKQLGLKYFQQIGKKEVTRFVESVYGEMISRSFTMKHGKLGMKTNANGYIILFRKISKFVVFHLTVLKNI